MTKLAIFLIIFLSITSANAITLEVDNVKLNDFYLALHDGTYHIIDSCEGDYDYVICINDDTANIIASDDHDSIIIPNQTIQVNETINSIDQSQSLNQADNESPDLNEAEKIDKSNELIANQTIQNDVIEDNLIEPMHEFDNKVTYDVTISHNEINDSGLNATLNIKNYYDTQKTIDLQSYFYRYSSKYSDVYETQLLVPARAEFNFTFPLEPTGIKNNTFNLKVKLKKQEIKTFKDFKFDIIYSNTTKLNNSIQINDSVGVITSNDSGNLSVNISAVQINSSNFSINESSKLSNHSNCFLETYGDSIEEINGTLYLNNETVMNQLNQTVELSLGKWSDDIELESSANIIDLMERDDNLSNMLSYKVIFGLLFMVLLCHVFRQITTKPNP